MTAWSVSRHYPKSGTKPLVHTGGLIIFLIVASAVYLDQVNPAEADLNRIREVFRSMESITHETPHSRQEQEVIAKSVRLEERAAYLMLAQIYRNRSENLTASNRTKLDPLDETTVQMGKGSNSVRPSDRSSDLIRDAATRRLVVDSQYENPPAWPSLLGGASFLYLWWLAIITFDLTFVWHLHIRHGGAQRYVEERQKASVGKSPPAPGARSSMTVMEFGTPESGVVATT